MMGMKWYIVKVAAGKEEKVKELIEKRINLKGFQDKIGRVLVPIKKFAEIRGGKKVTKEIKLYPGYIFIEMLYSPDNPESWYFIRSIPGVGSFLGATDPSPLSDKEVNDIIDALEASKEAKLDVHLKKGDTVRIKEGPFENFEGVVESVNEEKGTVKLIVNIFGRSSEVELECWQVETS